jgi:hypothetical protein
MCAHIGVILAKKKIKKLPYVLIQFFEKYFPVSVGTHLVCKATIRTSGISRVEGFSE